jgi:uncharacterized protein
MLRDIAALVAGLIFGVGLAVSQMINPAKVLGFLDIAGAWDPSLALVMAGALGVAAVGYHYALSRSRPWFADAYNLPTAGRIDARLLAGAAIFGVGWGLVGFCPGPAVASLAFGSIEAVIFVSAMLAGMALYRVGTGASKTEREPDAPVSHQTAPAREH